MPGRKGMSAGKKVSVRTGPTDQKGQTERIKRIGRTEESGQAVTGDRRIPSASRIAENGSSVRSVANAMAVTTIRSAANAMAGTTVRNAARVMTGRGVRTAAADISAMTEIPGVSGERTTGKPRRTDPSAKAGENIRTGTAVRTAAGTIIATAVRGTRAGASAESARAMIGNRVIC